MSEPTREQIVQSRTLLQNPYAYIGGDGKLEASPKKEPHHSSAEKLEHLIQTARSKRGKKPWKPEEIEDLASEFQNLLWFSRREIWPDLEFQSPIDVLSPTRALGAIGFNCKALDTLGQYRKMGTLIEVAGIIDTQATKVVISKQFTHDVQNFTAAHELGHALLHNTNGLHRDRPIDGAKLSESRNRMEMEADKFATFFLMPRKQVKRIFASLFGTEYFELTDERVFALSKGDLSGSNLTSKSTREISRILAKTDHYNGRHFLSMAKRFKVSTEAMAIRLEELELIGA